MVHRNELNCNDFIDVNSPNYIFKYYSPTNISFICGHDCDSFFVDGEYRIKMQHECHLRSKVLKDINIFIREFLLNTLYKNIMFVFATFFKVRFRKYSTIIKFKTLIVHSYCMNY